MALSLSLSLAAVCTTFLYISTLLSLMLCCSRLPTRSVPPPQLLPTLTLLSSPHSTSSPLLFSALLRSFNSSENDEFLSLFLLLLLLLLSQVKVRKRPALFSHLQQLELLTLNSFSAFSPNATIQMRSILNYSSPPPLAFLFIVCQSKYEKEKTKDECSWTLMWCCFPFVVFGDLLTVSIALLEMPPPPSPRSVQRNGGGRPLCVDCC